jgi:hypothetical protein
MNGDVRQAHLLSAILLNNYITGVIKDWHEKTDRHPIIKNVKLNCVYLYMMKQLWRKLNVTYRKQHVY